MGKKKKKKKKKKKREKKKKKKKKKKKVNRISLKRRRFLTSIIINTAADIDTAAGSIDATIPLLLGKRFYIINF